MNEFNENIPSNNIEQPNEDSIEESEETAPSLSDTGRSSPLVLRNVLRWSLTILISFGLGVLATYFVFLMPTQKELNQTNSDLNEAAQEIEALESQLAELDQINHELETQLDSIETRLNLLSIISDVRAAHLATLDDNYAGALLSLNDASQTLRQLNDILGENQSEVITTIQEDLSEIQEALKSDPEVAATELDRLTTNMIRLERTILK